MLKMSIEKYLKTMKLYELLNIEKEKCFLLYPYQDEQERIKKLEIKNHGTLDHYELAMKYETALAGLLSQDRNEIIKSFNKLERILVDIDIINYHYNNTALVFAPYYNNEELLLYCVEMYKLFTFYKQPVHNWIKNITDDPKIVIEGKKKQLYDNDLLKNLQLFPRFGMHCEANIKYLQDALTTNAKISAINAHNKLWNNTDK